MRRVLIAVGGTGGHVFPAISLAHQIKQNEPQTEIRIVGGSLAANRFFDKQSFPYHTVSCGRFSKNPFKLLKGLWNIGRGFFQTLRLFKEWRPDLIVGFGSFYTLPPLLAAKYAGIPIFLHESNSIPGKVNKLIAPYARLTGIQFPETGKLLKGDSILVHTPLRKGFKKGQNSRALAKDYFDLDVATPTLLVFGGSQGAKAINQLVSDAFTDHLKPTFQIIHLTGTPELKATISEKYKKAGIKACVKEFEPKMELAWEAADFVICRSGAGTIAEQLEFEVPGVLIPFPAAADNHQDINADFMVQQVNGAIKTKEAHLDAKLLATEVQRLFQDDRLWLNEKQKNIQTYKKNMALREFYNVICEAMEQKK